MNFLFKTKSLDWWIGFEFIFSIFLIRRVWRSLVTWFWRGVVCWGGLVGRVSVIKLVVWESVLAVILTRHHQILITIFPSPSAVSKRVMNEVQPFLWSNLTSASWMAPLWTPLLRWRGRGQCRGRHRIGSQRLTGPCHQVVIPETMWLYWGKLLQLLLIHGHPPHSSCLPVLDPGLTWTQCLTT